MVASRFEKWNELGFRPHLCTYRLNWARRTSWGWWDEWDDTALQTQGSKFEPWWSEAEHATTRSQRLPAKIEFLRVSGEETFCLFETWCARYTYVSVYHAVRCVHNIPSILWRGAQGSEFTMKPFRSQGCSSLFDKPFDLWNRCQSIRWPSDFHIISNPCR